MESYSSFLSSEKKIKVALVGCGRISHKHFEAIKYHNNYFELTAICDIAPQIANEMSAKYAVPCYLSLDSLLSEVRVDLVVLCTPSGLHPTQAIQCAQAGSHVITEKPMATNWFDGLKMVKACEENGVRLFVVKQNRLNPTIQHLKKAVDEKRFGKIYLVVVNVFWTRTQEYYDQSEWRGTPDLDGGAFMNQACHYIDLLHWCFGPVQSVQGKMATLGRNIDVEDTGVLSLAWKNGAIGSVNVTMLTFPKNLEGSITVIGEKGTVKVGGEALNEIQHWEFDEMNEEDQVILESSYQIRSVYGNGHVPYYKNIIDVLYNGAAPIVDGVEGLASLELLIASYRAAFNQKRVNLPLERSYELSSA